MINTSILNHLTIKHLNALHISDYHYCIQLDITISNRVSNPLKLDTMNDRHSFSDLNPFLPYRQGRLTH